ncbi:MAG: O-methyltransferase [Bacteroidota bacterium]
MDLINQKIFDYAEEHSKPIDDVLLQLYRETHLKVMNSIMLTGFLQGKLLQSFSEMLKPKMVLEIGTFTGYSAICFARGLSRGATLHTIEKDPELESICRKYFNLSGTADKIELHIGDALELIPRMEHTFDLVFIDCDKEIYSEVYELVIDKVVKGGYIIADNVLWHGKVFEEQKLSDRETKAIMQFNEKVKNDKRVDNFLLPFRDGLMIIKKL